MKKSILLILTLVLGIIPIANIAQTTISGGDVSGIWGLSGSPYQILDDITVQPGATLVIEAGVTVEGNQDVDFIVRGRLIASGSVDEKIHFTASDTTNGWGGIEFHDTATDDSEITNATIQYALAGIWLDSAFPTLNNLGIFNNTTGIYGNSNMNANGINVFEDIECYNNDAGLFCNWTFNSEFINCKFYQNQFGAFLQDHVGANDGLNFFNCMFYKNDVGFLTEADRRNPILTNCTVTENNQTEVQVNENGTKLTIVNSILWGSPFEDGIAIGGNPVIEVSYSNVSLFSGIWTGVGNINEEPQFIDPTNCDFNLKCTSPCVDAGNPDSPTDPDGSIADIGALWFDSSTLNGTVSNDSPVCEGGEVTLMADGGISYEWSGVNGFTSTSQNPVLSSVTSDMSGEYSVLIMTGDGCLIELSTEVVVNPMPIAGIDGSLSFCEGDNTTLTASGGTDYDWSTGENTALITVSSVDDYTVTVTDGNGCTDTETVSVISNQLPIAEIDGNLVFCDGESTTLTASGGTSYNWNTGDNMASITVSAADDYLVTVTDDNGCTDTETVTIIVNDLPSVELDLERDTFCINESNIELIGGTPNGGNYSGLGIMGNIFDPSAAGVGTHLITYVYEDANGCVNSDAQEITVEDGDCTTGINTIEINESVKVYPNPSSGNFSISLEDWTGRINIQIYDSQGRIIHMDNKESNQFEIEYIPIGIYFLKVSNDKYVASMKLIIQ